VFAQRRVSVRCRAAWSVWLTVFAVEDGLIAPRTRRAALYPVKVKAPTRPSGFGPAAPGTVP
jgi:hypothetical protein